MDLARHLQIQTLQPKVNLRNGIAGGIPRRHARAVFGDFGESLDAMPVAHLLDCLRMFGGQTALVDDANEGAVKGAAAWYCSVLEKRKTRLVRQAVTDAMSVASP